MITQEQIQELMGSKASVVDSNGEKIGKLEQIYLDDRTEEPQWATVSTGLFGSSESFVPLRGARVIADELEVQYTKEMVKDAPRLDSGEHLAPAQEDELDRYYGVAGDAEDAGDRSRETGYRGEDADPERSQTEQADETSTIGIVRTDGDTEETARPRFRKYVVTDGSQTPDDGGRRP